MYIYMGWCVEDANDIFVSAVSDLGPEFYEAESGDEPSFDTTGNEYVYQRTNIPPGLSIPMIVLKCQFLSPQ